MSKLKVTVVPDSFEYWKEDYSKRDSHFCELAELDLKKLRSRAVTHDHWVFLCRIESGADSDNAISMAIKTSNGFDDLEVMFLTFNDYSKIRDIVLDEMSKIKMTPAQEIKYQKFFNQRSEFNRKKLAKKKARLAREDKESSCLTAGFTRSTCGVSTVAE